MRGKDIVLYSSGLAFALAALSSWILFYLNAPEQVSTAELSQIQQDIANASQDVEADRVVADQAPAPVEIDTFMAWWYPGNPACNALIEAASYDLQVVKPEYFAIRDGGEFEFMLAENYQCNGYSELNAEKVKALASEQFVMVSASYAVDMDLFLQQDERTGQYTKKLVDFVNESGFTGVELDFEDFGGWSPEIYERYKAFVTRLGNKLHANGKELMLDLPATRNETEEQWYQLRLSELEQLPVDYLVIMAYDYQYDHGSGEPIAPLSWLAEVVRFTKDRVTDDSKIVIGIPAYGYSSDSSGRIRILTYEQAQAHRLFQSAVRDEASQEFIAHTNTETLVYQDSVSMSAKLDIVSSEGVGKVSVWHLGGNPWFQQ